MRRSRLASFLYLFPIDCTVALLNDLLLSRDLSIESSKLSFLETDHHPIPQELDERQIVAKRVFSNLDGGLPESRLHLFDECGTPGLRTADACKIVGDRLRRRCRRLDSSPGFHGALNF